MGADTKQLRTRIKSVDSTLHFTKAMGLVASSKLRRASEAMTKSRDYCQCLDTVIQRLAQSSECKKSPYMRPSKDNVRLIVIAGDRGLAGGYNANVFRLLRQYGNAQVTAIGKRICDRTGEAFISSEHFDYSQAQELADSLCRDFANGGFDRLGIICTKYVSMMTQQTTVEWILPIFSNAQESDNTTVFEPDELSLFNAAVPQYVAGMIFAAVCESFLSEVAARRMAMDSAGKNAQQMIEDLELEYNRARQGSITQEITEIVAGSNS